MTGDAGDFVSRLKLALPTRWFPDSTPILDTLLSGLAVAWSALYGLIVVVRQQSRIATMSGTFLDLASSDFFGATPSAPVHGSRRSLPHKDRTSVGTGTCDPGRAYVGLGRPHRV